MAAADASGANPRVVGGLDGLEVSRGFLLALLKGLSDGQMLVRSCAGGNHATWIVGHIAATDDAVLVDLAGRPSALPGSWEGRFGIGSQPSDDPAYYPPRDELMGVLKERRETLRPWIASLGEAELLAPVSGMWEPLARNRAMLATSLAFHEGMHSGQLSAARRAAGLGPLF